MPAGLQCFNDAGLVTFEATDYIGRVLGRIEILGANGPGSFTDSGLTAGTPFAVFFVGDDLNALDRYQSTLVTVSGQTISWSYSGELNFGPVPSGFIIYGIR
jgi:hypothetical protein